MHTRFEWSAQRTLVGGTNPPDCNANVAGSELQWGNSPTHVIPAWELGTATPQHLTRALAHASGLYCGVESGRDCATPWYWQL